VKLLAIETATRMCSVALADGDRVLVRRGDGPRLHAEVLLPWIRSLLAEAGIGFSDLDALAVDRGPGGFTSLRLGLGVAQGIALAGDLPCHPVSSLAALAAGAGPDAGPGAVLAALDARMGEVYACAYGFGDGPMPRPLGPEMLLAPAAVRAPCETPWIGLGDAFAVHRDGLPPGLCAQAREIHADVWPDAPALTRLAAHIAPVQAHRLEPVYLRDQVTG